ncbi:TetR/AcrR family transcriptional regulator [Nocardia pseudovaccinii]|uniref:TetR/AcrR family transcriptional regulator n=1 Tax=Nocardia pseudovaccinii TaxID=189540 RepID=UPI003D92EA72
MNKAVDTRTALVAAASELLTKGGPDHVTLRAVGAATGVSRTAPYRHFQDKDALLSTVAAENLTWLIDQMRQAAADTTGEGTPLYRACLAYVRGAMDRPDHYRLEFGDYQIQSPGQVLLDAADECAAYFYELVADAQRDRILVPGDVREIAALIWAMLHGQVHLTLAEHLHEPRTVEGATVMPRLIALALQSLAPH